MTTTIPAKLLAATCATALTIALATACGDDDTDQNADNNPAGAAATPNDDATQTAGTNSANGSEPATDQGQIRALIDRVQAAFKTGDGDVVCDSLATPGHKDLADYADTMSLPGSSSCPEIVAAIAKQNRAANLDQPPVKVVAVRINGSKATALMKVGGSEPLRQSYDKIDGQWKVRTFGIGAAVKTQNAP